MADPSIHFLVGDATQPVERPAVIAHIVNDVGAWGRGFVLAVSRRWPQPEQAYRDRYRTVGLLLGTINTVEVGPGLWVANMVAQHGVGRRDGPPIRYWALAECLARAAEAAAEVGAGLHMPRIGTGLAGGDWGAVEGVVRARCGGVPVFVYDLPVSR